ncbi:unnamed protein product [Arabis nemorensis]|uniref:Uncharacterized protein n=1 Tax=Arabis nemorensis TaxID=586526 RepID=A0A565AUD4_9BRAS|nr:unnamed protein product [Arabis nemorensis]
MDGHIGPAVTEGRGFFLGGGFSAGGAGTSDCDELEMPTKSPVDGSLSLARSSGSGGSGGTGGCRGDGPVNHRRLAGRLTRTHINALRAMEDKREVGEETHRKTGLRRRCDDNSLETRELALLQGGEEDLTDEASTAVMASRRLRVLGSRV